MATPNFTYFDLGNVLIHFDHRRGARQMAEVARISEQLVWEVVFERDLEMQYERGAISTREFYETFCARTETRPDYGALLLAASDIFEMNDEMVPLLADLRGQGQRVGILSNTNEAHWRFITEGRFPIVHQYFECYALSYELRSTKPEPAVYERAAELADVAPRDIFFTDDRLENVEAARRVGFDAVHYVGVEPLREALRARGILD